MDWGKGSEIQSFSRFSQSFTRGKPIGRKLAGRGKFRSEPGFVPFGTKVYAQDLIIFAAAISRRVGPVCTVATEAKSGGEGGGGETEKSKSKAPA